MPEAGGKEFNLEFTKQLGSLFYLKKWGFTCRSKRRKLLFKQRRCFRTTTKKNKAPIVQIFLTYRQIARNKFQSTNVEGTLNSNSGRYIKFLPRYVQTLDTNRTIKSVRDPNLQNISYPFREGARKKKKIQEKGNTKGPRLSQEGIIGLIFSSDYCSIEVTLCLGTYFNDEQFKRSGLWKEQDIHAAHWQCGVFGCEKSREKIVTPSCVRFQAKAVNLGELSMV